MRNWRLFLLSGLILVPIIFAPHVYAAVTVGVTPASQTVAEYSPVSYAVSVGAPAFPDEHYSLSLSGLPSGSLFSFSPNPVTVPLGGASSTLSIDAGSICPGSYSITVTASHVGPTTGSDSSSSSAVALAVTPSGPPLRATISSDKSAYRIGDKVTVLMSVNKPAFATLLISPPSGAPLGPFYYTFYGPTYALSKTLTASQPIGRWTVSLQTQVCSEFDSQVAYFDISPDTYDVTVSLAGVPSQVSINLQVDGQNQGSVAGSEIKSLSFKVDSSHALAVDQYVPGETGTRYYCSQNTWNVGSSGSHTFEYETQYLFTVGTDPDGITQVTGGGWFKADSTVQTSQVPANVTGPPGTLYMFKGWEVDGTPQPGTTLTLTLDKPHKAIAKYETQYQLLVDSPYGNPTGAGYYSAGSTATFSVTSPVGFLVQQVFYGWEGDYSGTSPQGSVVMNKPMHVKADWNTGYFQLYLALGVVAAVIVLAAFLLWRKRHAAAAPSLKPTPSMPGEPGPPSEAPGGTLPETSAGGMTCGSCGADVPAGQSFCHNCGAKMDMGEQQA